MARDETALVDRSGELSRQAEIKAARLDDGTEVGRLKAQVIRALNRYRVFTLAAKIVRDRSHLLVSPLQEFAEALHQSERAWQDYNDAVSRLDELGVRVKTVRRDAFR